MIQLHKIQLAMSNCYLVLGERPILVDTGSPGEGKRILAALRGYGVELADLSLILHTHGHSDHCGSTLELIRQHKIPTGIHSADSHMIRQGKNDFLKTTRPIARWIRPFVDKPFPAFEPDLFIDDLADLGAFGVRGSLHHTLGHTEGSISIVFDSYEAIIGDVMMGGYMGGAFWPHLPDYHYFADDLTIIRQSIKKVLTFEAEVYYVGHGGPLTRDRIEARFAKDLPAY